MAAAAACGAAASPRGKAAATAAGAAGGRAAAAISLDVHQRLHGRDSEDSSDDFVLHHVGRSALFDKDLDQRVAYSCTMVVEGLTCTHRISL